MDEVGQDASGYTLAEGPELFDFARAHAWIATESYWAEGIPLDTFVRAARNSMLLSLRHREDGMVAMARVVTDRATFAWICDVFVHANHRGRGLGGRLIEAVRAHPDLQGLRRMHLATQDAHELYRRFGFGPMTHVDRWMQIHQPDVYRR